jgi:hypothetical protein
MPSKRSGLEKAIYQVEEAIKKRKSDATTNQVTLEHLKKLLSDDQNEEEEAIKASNASLSPNNTPPVPDQAVRGTSADDQLALEGVENPLQLLARASDLRIASPRTLRGSVSTPGSRVNGNDDGPYLDVHSFFSANEGEL